MDATQIFPEWSFGSERGLRKAVRVTISFDSGQPLTGEEQINLVLAIANHADRTAFEQLFRHFGPRLKTFVMRRGLSASPAEEIVQETMLSVWRKASYFDPTRAGVATWIFTIARNLSIDYQRRDRSDPDIDDEAGDRQDPPLSGEAILIAEERDERVRDALKTLSAEQLAVVRLSFFSEKPHVEIAEELAIPLGTVKSRVRLAMQRLRGLLEDLA